MTGYAAWLKEGSLGCGGSVSGACSKGAGTDAEFGGY